jgi:hypothetical protein
MGRMTSLLTRNGIPPQVVGSLTEPQRQCVMSYAANGRKEKYDNWRNAVAEALRPFATIVANVADSLLNWGATESQTPSRAFIRLVSTHLRVGETNFQTDLNLHSDRRDALMKLKERAFVSLRLLCVSSTPSSFIDLTNREDMESFLDEHRIDNGRIYKTELLTLAQRDGWLVQPKAWDIIVFDAQTPHRPRGALLPHQRVLQQASIGLQLPVGWRERVKSGDAPQPYLGLRQLSFWQERLQEHLKRQSS